ncbi:MAG TPA: sulfatase-like hydrolase/transferase [Candidatus Hydrogenedentes bacterium]|nr:sulfatase-like hydrolase/transferase [Candidatus Hydrogenedentota bacterium]HNT87368.1 sulfatase-like hydrolase/transferase [Candidatus Hydrogenedentota bacterium]
MADRIDRRGFLGSAAATLAGASVCARAQDDAATASARTAARPNVLLIHGDQHRIECLGAYSNNEIRTPHLDAIATDGVRFENSFCPYPVCTPSRYSLLSGRYVHEHRGWTNHCTLFPGTETFPSVLKHAGYPTKAVGKMHFTPTYLDVGFEEMILSEQDGPGRWDDDYHRALRDAGLVDRNDLEDQRKEYRDRARPEYWQTFGALPTNLPDAFYSTQWIGDHAVETIEGWGTSGQLLMVGFIKPHHPFDPPASWAERYEPDALSLLPGWTDACLPHDLELHRGYFPHESLTVAALQRVMAYYYASIEQIDHQVGRMIEVLRRKGLYDNTMIIYTSDHGEYLGCHHMLLKGNYMYDPLVKVPLIIKYPAGKFGGRVSQAMVSNIDVAPTILRQASCAVPDGMRGIDLAAEDIGRDHVFAESAGGTHAMARTGTRKLLLSRKHGKSLFFDIEHDPAEVHDRYDDPACRDEIQALTRAIEAWRSFDDLPPTYLDENAPVIDQPNVASRDDDHRDRMAAYCRKMMAQ